MSDIKGLPKYWLDKYWAKRCRVNSHFDKQLIERQAAHGQSNVLINRWLVNKYSDGFYSSHCISSLLIEDLAKLVLVLR